MNNFRVNFVSIVLVCFLGLFNSCATSDPLTSVTEERIGLTRGMIRISKYVFFDQFEVRNLDYLEFMHWISAAHGTNSIEYNRIVPDTTVWSKLDPNYIELDAYYLRHPSYRNYPVVGVSYEQALLYSEWRSDRNMEWMLIQNGIFKHTPNLNKDSLFTIEKYYNGEFMGLKPDPRFTIYPHYTLPDSSAYTKAQKIADSINIKNYKSCRKKFCDEHLLISCHCLDSISDRTIKRPYGVDPLKATRCSFCRKELITHLKGNVTEMTNIKGVYYGLSFVDSCSANNYVYRKKESLINSYSGFRNVCIFKERQNHLSRASK